MGEERTYFRRKLPHYQPKHATYFITFRLAETLPGEAVERLCGEREMKLGLVGQDNILSYKIHKQFFAKYDQLLNKGTHGPTWLKNDSIAKIVADTIHYWDGKRYTLLCYCIMPNHVHLVIENPVGQLDKLSYTLSPILHSIKRYTAREANKILQRSGAFWQHESYDHVVRDGKELERVIWYVLNNPVKAGLATDWQKWKWSFVRHDIY